MLKFLRNQLSKAPCTKAIAGVILGVAACGDQTDPQFLTLSELKAPYGLQTLDLGNGNVRLTWHAHQVSAQFEGFNLYGAKRKQIETYFQNQQIIEGQALHLVDSKGKEVEEGKKILEAMSYNAEQPFERVEADESSNKTEYYPIQLEKGQIPTCRPSGQGKAPCLANLKGKTGPYYGMTYVELDKLKTGEEYCFLVASAADKGKKISAVSSEIKCLVPKQRGRLNLVDAGVGVSKSQTLDFSYLRETCKKNSVGCLNQIQLKESGRCGAQTSQTLCLEKFSKDGLFHFTAGKSAGIVDAGFNSHGLENGLPQIAPMKGFSQNGNLSGYAPPNHSIPVSKKHTYVIAEAANEELSSFYYHVLHVIDIDHMQGLVDFEIRLSEKQNAPNK